jgi:CRISPR-associated protein Csh2
MEAKRAEILFSYDARMSNPNGDPEENRPRIDRITGKNYVTEFRLKRTIRDYLAKVMNQRIFMRQELVSDKSLELKQIEDLASSYITKSGKGKSIDKIKFIKDHIDIRLFGILFAVGDIHFKQTGPIQFSIGQSLNKVDEISIRMTRVVPTKEGAKAGTFGEKSVVRYSFIEFHGFVNNNVAKEVNLSEDDVQQMLIGMWKGTDSLTTSSKFGQKSRLLIKVNYKDDGYIGDLDLKCKLESKTEIIENISHVTLDVKDLFNVLEKNKNLIESIEYKFDSDLVCHAEIQGNFETLIKKWSDKVGIKISRLNP